MRNRLVGRPVKNSRDGHSLPRLGGAFFCAQEQREKLAGRVYQLFDRSSSYAGANIRSRSYRPYARDDRRSAQVKTLAENA